MRRPPRREIARVPVDPDRATVYAEGWQSWSATQILPVTAAPSVPPPDSRGTPVGALNTGSYGSSQILASSVTSMSNACSGRPCTAMSPNVRPARCYA